MTPPSRSDSLARPGGRARWVPVDERGAPLSTQDREVDRAAWNALRPHGDAVDVKTTVRSTGIDIEDYDGFVDVSVSVQEDGIDIRVNDLELFVRKQHITLTQKHPPYPISRWTLLWEGDLA